MVSKKKAAKKKAPARRSAPRSQAKAKPVKAAPQQQAQEQQAAVEPQAETKVEQAIEFPVLTHVIKGGDRVPVMATDEAHLNRLRAEHGAEAVEVTR